MTNVDIEWCTRVAAPRFGINPIVASRAVSLGNTRRGALRASPRTLSQNGQRVATPDSSALARLKCESSERHSTQPRDEHITPAHSQVGHCTQVRRGR